MVRVRGVAGPIWNVRKITPIRLVSGRGDPLRKLMDFSRFDDIQNSFLESTVYWQKKDCWVFLLDFRWVRNSVFAYRELRPWESDIRVHISITRNGLNQLRGKRGGFFSSIICISRQEINRQLFCNYLPLDKGEALHLNKIEFPLPKGASCQVWLKLARWFLSWRFLNFVNVFSIFQITSWKS